MPMEKLRIFSSFVYNMAEASLDVVEMQVPSGIEELLGNANFDYTMVNDYSNLDYAMMNLNVGFEYKFTDKMAFTADGTFIDLTDDEGYVYGDETGSFFMIRTGFKIDF